MGGGSNLHFSKPCRWSLTHGIDTFISFEEGLPFGVVVFILGPFSLLQLLSLSLQWPSGKPPWSWRCIAVCSVVIKSVFLSSFLNCSRRSTLILMLESQINLLLCILYYENERDHLWLRPPLPLSFATPALATAAGYITVLICFPIIIQSTYIHMCASRYKVPLQTYLFLQILLLYSIISLL